MANFEKAYKRVIGNEGGYANHPSDKGGETYMGVSRRFHPDWAGWEIIDEEKQKGKIKHNSKLKDVALDELVRRFYKAKFWDKIHGDKIINQSIADNFFDFVINSGQAVRRMQRALNETGQKVVEDNVCGPATINAINSADPLKLNFHFNEARRKHYRDLVIFDPSQRVFLSGWLNRVEKFENVV